MLKIELLANRNKSQKNIINERTKKGSVHAAGGLNWGYSNGLPKINDAYIPILAQLAMSSDIGAKTNKPYDCIFDDGVKMKIRLEGNGKKINNIQYPKQISSYDDKSILGIYFRRRIGAKIGKDLVISSIAETKIKIIKKNNRNQVTILNEIKRDKSLEKELIEKFITKEILREYGRLDIEIEKGKNGIYSINFGV